MKAAITALAKKFPYVCPFIINCMSAKKQMKDLKETVKFLRKKYKHEPSIGIVLGSGLGKFVEEITIEKEVAYGDIPNFPVSTVEGHTGKLIFC